MEPVAARRTGNCSGSPPGAAKTSKFPLDTKTGGPLRVCRSGAADPPGCVFHENAFLRQEVARTNLWESPFPGKWTAADERRLPKLTCTGDRRQPKQAILSSWSATRPVGPKRQSGDVTPALNGQRRDWAWRQELQRQPQAGHAARAVHPILQRQRPAVAFGDLPAQH